MSLSWLLAKRFRNLDVARLEFSPGSNLFYGENGSGKSSLLEAAYYLGCFRSFRAHSSGDLIHQHSEEFLLRGKIEVGEQNWELGVSRANSGKRDIRLNGSGCSRLSDVARLLPSLFLGPDSVNILTGAPEVRRRFLNWGAFHVEQGFAEVWQQGNRCLKQRNRLLRESRYNERMFDSWSTQLVDRADKIDKIRGDYLSKFIPIFYEVAGKIAEIEDFEFHYYRGWPDSSSLTEVYDEDIRLDRKKGFTQRGFQRADIRITIGGKPVGRVCSRGELKSLAWSMILAQGAVTVSQNAVFLVDDLISEFDVERRQRIARYLVETGNQVLITGVERSTLEHCYQNMGASMFHVKHGRIKKE